MMSLCRHRTPHVWTLVQAEFFHTYMSENTVVPAADFPPSSTTPTPGTKAIAARFLGAGHSAGRVVAALGAINVSLPDCAVGWSDCENDGPAASSSAANPT